MLQLGGYGRDHLREEGGKSVPGPGREHTEHTWSKYRHPVGPASTPIASAGRSLGAVLSCRPLVTLARLPRLCLAHPLASSPAHQLTNSLAADPTCSRPYSPNTMKYLSATHLKCRPLDLVLLLELNLDLHRCNSVLACCRVDCVCGVELQAAGGGDRATRQRRANHG